LIQQKASEDTSTLSERQNGSEVKLCGLVSGLKEINTKKGDRMAFLTLEDMKGFVEVVLFPEVYKASVHYLRGDDPILVRGFLDLSEDPAGEGRAAATGKAKIRGIEIQSLPDPTALPKALRLRIPLDGLTSGTLADLKEILLLHQGDHRVFLHFMNGKKEDTVLGLPDRMAVQPSPDLESSLKSLLPACTLTLG
jgi:DNA polymerase-3 subunit alpha